MWGTEHFQNHDLKTFFLFLIDISQTADIVFRVFDFTVHFIIYIMHKTYKDKQYYWSWRGSATACLFA